ncbi:MAG TPA: endonuclease/exonuclease/phosphatase family protein [Kofleriaceae bacterium]|nr:endonuclease/exonuclease/phosphatase family protein [Kofleriaceae bacterium]
MRWIWCAVLASGCVSIDDTPKPWVAAGQIAAPLTPELGPAVTPPRVPTTLRIASWNVERGEHPDALADEIMTSPVLASADILIVQEIENHPGELGSRASRLAAALGMTWFYAPARTQDEGTHGDAILSRFPLSSPEVKQLPFVDQPVNSRTRIAQRAVVDLGTRTFTLVNVHLDTRLAPVDRIRQLDPAVADNPPVTVVGGDLNTLPWIWVDTAVPLTSSEAVLGQDQAQIVDDYLAAQGFATPIVHDTDTHESVIDMRLDALCPRGLPVLDAGVDYTVSGSDHYAVWIDIDVR